MLCRQLLLDELGMNQEFFDVLRDEYIRPITGVLFPEYGGATLDSHKVFVVKYKLGEDEDLACHFDNAEVCRGDAGGLPNPPIQTGWTVIRRTSGGFTERWAIGGSLVSRYKQNKRHK